MAFDAFTCQCDDVRMWWQFLSTEDWKVVHRDQYWDILASSFSQQWLYRVLFLRYKATKSTKSTPMFLGDMSPPSPGWRSKRSKLQPASCWFLDWITLELWIWRRYVRPKSLLTFIGLHGVIFQKTEHIRYGLNFIPSGNFHSPRHYYFLWPG
jgi:hypothetical protein